MEWQGASLRGWNNFQKGAYTARYLGCRVLISNSERITRELWGVLSSKSKRIVRGSEGVLISERDRLVRGYKGVLISKSSYHMEKLVAQGTPWKCRGIRSLLSQGTPWKSRGSRHKQRYAEIGGRGRPWASLGGRGRGGVGCRIVATRPR